jgi:SecD/SecF fusion protein
MKIQVKQADGTTKTDGIGNHYVQASRTAGGDNMITIRTEEFAGAQVQTQLEQQFKGKLDAPKLDTAGAVIGSEQGWRSAIAVVLALFGIFFYLWFRYEVSFALGALISLVHDVVIVLGGSVLLGQEMSLVHIGAALTVAGYSVNDTIIVFDRVREIIRTRQGTIMDLMNEAVSLTFSRTLLTSLVTFIPMVVLFFFGGPAMREFSLPIVIGVLVGTYSSIFVACPIVLWHARKTGVSLHRQLLREEEQKAMGIDASHKVA